MPQVKSKNKGRGGEISPVKASETVSPGFVCRCQNSEGGVLRKWNKSIIQYYEIRETDYSNL